jgi:hypothetical protein
MPSYKHRGVEVTRLLVTALSQSHSLRTGFMSLPTDSLVGEISRCSDGEYADNRWCSFGLSRRVDWLVEGNVSEKRTVSILGATNPHGDLTQNNFIKIVTDVKLLNLTWIWPPSSLQRRVASKAIALMMETAGTFDVVKLLPDYAAQLPRSQSFSTVVLFKVGNFLSNC